MDIKTVAVRLTTLNADYKKGMKESGDSVSAFSKMTTAALAAAGVAAVGFAKKAADGYVAYGKTIMGLSRVSGENVETMSKFNFAAQQSGVSSETLANGIKFLQKNMASNNAEFEKLGVSTRNADGTYRGVRDVFLDTADAISKMSNATEKADAIRQIFGRNGQALGAMLNKGRDGIIALEAEATKYGLVLTKDNLPAIQANIKAHREHDAAMQGATVQIGQSVLPMITSMVEVFAKLPGPIASSLAPLAGLVLGIGGLSKAMGMLGLSLGPWGAVIALVGAGGLLIKNRLDEGAKSVDGLKASVDKTVAGATSMDDLNRIMGKTRTEMHGLKQAADDVHAPWDVFYKKDLREGTAALGVSLIAQEALRAEVNRYAEAHGVSTDVAMAAVQGEQAKARALKEHGSAAKMTAEEVKALTEANKAENDALRASMDPQFAALDAMQKLGEAKQKAQEQEWAVVTALQAYNSAVLLYGPNSAAATEALWKLNDAKAVQSQTTNDLARANLDLDVAVNNLEVAFKTGAVSIEQTKETLQGWVDQGRITQGQADAINHRFWLMKGKADELNGTAVRVGVDADTSGFFGKLHGVWAALDATKVKMVDNFGASGSFGWGKFIDNQKAFWGGSHADGSPLGEGWNLINEEGPEALYKSGSKVSVMSAPQTRRMLTSASGGGGRGAAGSTTEIHHHTNHVTVQAPLGVDVRDITRTISDELRRLEDSRSGQR